MQILQADLFEVRLYKCPVDPVAAHSTCE